MNRIARPLLSDTVPPGLVRMRVIATGLLVLMAALFFVARAFEPAHPGLGYLRSFAEAAMVGGLADWFAVTALFRHPLGLPIPHTAIVPRNKDRIGTTLASFLRANFLTPAVVARRMRRVDVASAFRSEEHTSELQSLMRISYAVFCLKKKKTYTTKNNTNNKIITIE